MAMSAEVKIASPSPAMMTSPYEWKILGTDENSLNKHWWIGDIKR